VATSKLLLIPSISIFALSGCAQLLGLDEVKGAPPPQQADASVADASADAMVDSLLCASADISPAIGSATGNTEAASNASDQSCGSANSNDLLLAWRAPVTDYYVFDTQGSNFDTVLGLYDDCDGNEVACNNDSATGTDSKVVLKVEQDTELLVAVDGFAGDSGDVTVNVGRVSCPDFDLEGQTFPLSLSTSGFGDDTSNACGGAGQEDRAYHWVPPTDGLYAFTVTAPGYRPIVTLVDGAECGDTELGCNKALEPDFKSEVVRRLFAGQPVSVYVDGVDGAGAFDIDIHEVVATCPSEVLVENVTSMATYLPRTMTTSCSFPEIRNGVNIPQELGDKTYKVAIPSAGLGCFGGCDIQINSGSLFSAALLEGGDCSGAELECSEADSFILLNVGMDETETQERTLIITNRDPIGADTLTVSMSCQIACA